MQKGDEQMAALSTVCVGDNPAWTRVGDLSQ